MLLKLFILLLIPLLAAPLGGTTCPTSFLNLVGDGCISACPPRASISSGQCVCLWPYTLSSNNDACLCSDLVDTDGTSCVSACSYGASDNGEGICVCANGYSGTLCDTCIGYTGVDAASCVASCPDHSTVDASGNCVCDGTLIVSGNSCICNSGNLINVDGASCVSACPDRSSENNGVCDCDSPFVETGGVCGCANGDSVSLDGTTCTSSCPPNSSPMGVQCVCDGTFFLDGNSCSSTCSIVKNLDGTACLNSCPARSSNFGGQCVCDGAFQVSADGQSCVCAGANDKISIDGSSCISSCPAYSSLNSGGQCVCDGTLIANGNTCGCSSGEINLAGTGCISSCPAHSSNQGGQCQCDITWTIEATNKASCVCPGASQQSLDGLSCIPSCPSHTTVVSNACVCNSALNFVLSANKQSCECKPGTVLNSGSNTCLTCDSSCKTCSGPNSNECLSCYSGYQLSAAKTCTVVAKPPSTSSPSVETAKTTGKISSASIAASSIASAGNSGAMRVSLVGNMFQYLKFMNISYSEQLSNMLENLNSQLLPFDIGVGVPQSMQDESNYKTLAYQFTKYEQTHPSFLMNFWDDLSILVVVIGIVGVLVGLQFLLNKFYKQKTMWKLIFSKASLMAQGFLLTYTYNDLGSIIFYGLLDFKSAKKYSGVHVLNLIIAVLLLLAEVGILIAHYTLLTKYRRIKRARREKELEEFLEKHENLKAFFEDFNDFSFIQQGFLLVAIFRDMLSNLVLVTLYQYPLAESTLFMVFSLLMIVYILYSGPFKDILNAIQQILCELILLLVNACIFINAVMDHIGSSDYETRDNLGSIVVISNIVFNFVPMVFLGITVWQFSKELYAYIKRWLNKRKVANVEKKEELSLKSDMNNSTQRILRGLSLDVPGRSSLIEEHKSTTTIILHKVSEDLEILGSQNQITTGESKMISRDNSGILEMKVDGEDQEHHRELIAEKKNEGNSGNSNWLNPNNNGRVRKMKIKKRRLSPQLDGLNNGGEVMSELKLEGNDAVE